MSETTPDDARLAELQDAAATRQVSPGVGFVGCHGRSRVLRVRVANVNRQRMRVECPHGCGVHDASHAMSRPLRSDEPEPELVEVPPHTYDPTVPDPDAPPDSSSTRRQVSDAAIFEAVPVGGDALLRETAEAVGYVGDTADASFTKRLRRMNARAEKEGSPAPFVITPGNGPKPAKVRRVEVPSNDG